LGYCKYVEVDFAGDKAMIDVMKFVAEHGSKFDHLIRER
jgi:hypothetical protein